jgi:hypothetical protein
MRGLYGNSNVLGDRCWTKLLSRHSPSKQTLTQVVYRDLTRLENRPAGETNTDPLRALEEQIGERQRSIIELKRSQNSLLNISKLPPEILGHIFWQSAVPDGFEKRCLNFLLVCHNWNEIASGTPELWSFWGHTLQDWTERHLRYKETPLDLVLDEGKLEGETLNTSLQNALRDRASRDTIQLVHLRAGDRELLNSILCALTSDGKEVRRSSVGSVILQNEDTDSVDASRFLAYNRFPRLRHLDLTNCTISSWDHLTPQTTSLKALVLHLSYPSVIPTTPQLITVLTSNPALRKLVLTRNSVPNDRNEDPSRVSLPHLKELKLAGKCKEVSTLLDRLDHPDIMDNLDIALTHPAVDISGTIGPYLRGYFRRRGGSQGCLGL